MTPRTPNGNGHGAMLTMVVPFYNEEGSVTSVVGVLRDAFTNHGVEYELILVDNGSRDGTARLLGDVAAGDPRIRVIHVEVNEGYGSGILAGLACATGDLVGFMCGDGQIRSDDVVSVYRGIASGDCDLCKVTRRTRKDGPVRWLVSFIYNAIFWVMFRCPTFDANGNPKIFKREWLDRFELQSKDWFIDAELMIKANRLRLKIREVPVVFYPRVAGSSHVDFGTLVEWSKNLARYPLSREFREWKTSRL